MSVASAKRGKIPKLSSSLEPTLHDAEATLSRPNGAVVMLSIRAHLLALVFESSNAGLPVHLAGRTKPVLYSTSLYSPKLVLYIL